LRLNISDKIISDDDIKNIFKDFKNDEHTFDYKRFLGNLKAFQLNSNDLYGGTTQEVKKNPHPNQMNLLASTEEEAK
jgi:hypothetical protein